MRKITREEALEYHSRGRKGKIEVVPTKPCRTQRDLSLAYSPGVAEPCLEIAKDPENVYEYTARGNLVAVISNGTAVLGLGNIGPARRQAGHGREGRPLQALRRHRRLRHRDGRRGAERASSTRSPGSSRPSAGSTSRTSRRRSASRSRKRSRSAMKIPVFHDDQHGTAIISAAALLNALEVVGKKIDEVKVVFVGAGAAAIACARLYMSYGVRRENLLMVDKAGVIYKGRTGGDMNPYKAAFAVDTPDAHAGRRAAGRRRLRRPLDQGGIVTGEMLKGMARDPIVFALANPDPEITPEEARAARPDVIMATGRSDYPEPGQQRPRLPVHLPRRARRAARPRSTSEMKMAAAQALAALAKMDVPDSVSKAYGGETFRFGRDYLIPKPFDFRVLLWVAPAVAEAAMTSGVARRPDPGHERLPAAARGDDLALARGDERRAREGASGIPGASSSRKGSTRRSCGPRRSWRRRGSAARSCSPARRRSRGLLGRSPAARLHRDHPHEPLPASSTEYARKLEELRRRSRRHLRGGAPQDGAQCAITSGR